MADEDLENEAPTVDFLLERLRKSDDYAGISSQPNSLTQDDKSYLLSKEEMLWGVASEGCPRLDSIAMNLAEKEGQVAGRTKKHTKKKMELRK